MCFLKHTQIRLILWDFALLPNVKPKLRYNLYVERTLEIYFLIFSSQSQADFMASSRVDSAFQPNTLLALVVSA